MTPIEDAPEWLIELACKRKSNAPRAAAQGGVPVPEYVKGGGELGRSTDPKDCYQPLTEDEIRAALSVINPDIDRKEWIGIGCAIYKQLGDEKGFEVWNSWSKRGKKYDPSDIGTQWDSLVRADGYGWNAGTILHLAHEADPDWRLKFPQPSTATNEEPTSKTEAQVQADKPAQLSTPYTGPLLFDPWAPYIVPAFPFDTLPPVLQQFVASQSVVIGGDPSAMAMAVLAACSGALDHRFRLKMMKHGGWYANPRLWVLLVGPPSYKKTPLINAACAPLEAYQDKVLHEYQIAMQGYEAAKERKEEALEKPAPPPRYVVYDSTVEKLGEILARKPKGLLVKRDEVSGWIGAMEQYTRGGGAAANRAFWLKAYDGGGFAIDQISRGEMYVENLSVSLIGGIQPARLVQLQGLTSDGLLQRLLPIMLMPGKLALDQPSDDEGYRELIIALIEAKQQQLELSKEAVSKLDELRTYLHGLEQASTGLAAGFDTFVGKLAGVAGTLALILTVADDPSAESWGFAGVSPATIEKVQSIIVDFLVPHAFEFYRTAEASTNGDRLRQVASYVLTSGETRFTPSDFTRNVASMRNLSLREVNERVSPLVAAEWLDPDMRGLDNRSWKLNKYVTEQFAERRRLEEEQKQQIARLMGSPRRGRPT